MATSNLSVQTRFKQIYLFTDKADDPLIRHLTGRDVDLHADDLLEVASQIIALHPTPAQPPMYDIEELHYALQKSERSYEVKIHPKFSMRFRLDTTYPPLFHLISNPHLRPCFTTPIWVISDEADSGAALASLDEIDDFNKKRFQETFFYGQRAFQTLNWNKLLLNPNDKSHTFITLHPIPISEKFDPSDLKYLGAHLHHLEDESVVDDNGFVQIQSSKRAAIVRDPSPPNTEEYVIVPKEEERDPGDF